MNSSENVDDQEHFGFTESFFKFAPANIDDYTKHKLLNMQEENMRPQRSIEINDKLTGERYQKNKLDDKESDEENQISKIDEEKIIEDKEIMKLKKCRQGNRKEK